MAKRRLSQALNDAYMEEMARDPKIILFGEDVEASNFGDTRGLLAKFGRSRIRNTPISENAMSGMAIGAALSGYRVVCHLMFGNFMYTAFDNIANQAAKMRLMTGGQARLPVTFFGAYGAGTSTAAQHSDTPYPALMNQGGINIVVPSNPSDAKGLLKAVLRGDNPTCFLMPRLRGGALGEVPDGDYLVPLGKADIRRSGKDVTIVAIGASVSHALRAGEELEKLNIDAEIIDPRTLVPLDEGCILDSVTKTGRLVIVDEARDRCSAASHIAALVVDRGFAVLKAPIKRVTAPNISMPYAPGVEKALLPDPEKIVAAARLLVAYHR